uniref:Abnormal cell migration protein 18-like fibronectin type I domain-containing protein n=1 Tax=Romanomermis culicivorax TaxID=13658 RepID=A0A915KAH0_ROMCU
MFRAIAFFLTVTIATCSDVWNSDNDDEPCDWRDDDSLIFDDNVTTLSDVTVIRCVNGTKVYGCRMSAVTLPSSDTVLFNPSHVVSYGETAIVGKFLLLCQKVFDHYHSTSTSQQKNETRFVKIGCFVDGRVLAPGQTYQNGTEYYECTTNDDAAAVDDDDIDLRKAGCVDTYGSVAKLNNYHDVNGFRYQCLEDPLTGKYALKPHGCLDNDLFYKINDIIMISDYWYTCKKSNDDLTIAPGGCIVDYGFVHLGQTFHTKGFVGRCLLVKNDLIRGAEKIQMEMIGCLGGSSGGFEEHAVDERWLESDSKGYRVEMACIQITSKRLMKLATRCSIVDSNGRRLFLEPDSFTRLERKTLWTCHKTIFGTLMSNVVENATMQDTAEAIMTGLKYIEH